MTLSAPAWAHQGDPRPACCGPRSTLRQRVLSQEPRVIHVVPLTTTIRQRVSKVSVAADVVAGVTSESAAQCQHIRAVSTACVAEDVGNVGLVLLQQIGETVPVLLDL